GERLDHRRGGTWHHAQRRRQLAHRHQVAIAVRVRQPALPGVDRLQVVLDRARRTHRGDRVPPRMGGTLDRAFDSPEDKRRYNARLFTTIAGRYDFITRLLSYGRDQAWKRDLMAPAGIAPGHRVLDLATGTGDLALAAAAQGAAVVGLDLAPRMIRLARIKPGAGAVRFLVGDMTSLPLPPASGAVATTRYGLRNSP